MNKSIIKSLLIGLVLSFSACTSNYIDINKEPGTVDKDEMERDDYITRVPLLGLQSFVVANDVNLNQFVECLLGGSYGGYLSDSNDGFKQKYSTYNPEEHWVQVPFNDLIPKAYQHYNDLQTYTKNEVLLSVAAVNKVAILSRVTAIYGPIPYSEIGKDGKQTAPYDSEPEIYNTMFKELDAAIEVLTRHRTDQFSPLADRVYGGNVEKWAKFANSLKLRLAMRIVNADEGLAKTKAEEAVNSEVGVFLTNSDNATYKTQKNPFRVVMYEYNGGDSRVSADITSYMNGFNDPRREAYFTPSTFTTEQGSKTVNGYYGLRNGVLVPRGEYRKYSNMKVGINTEIQWINAAEVTFLRAEGALRGWNMQGQAENLYNEAIELSFDQWGVSGASSYIDDAKSTPNIYKDPQGHFTYTGKVSPVTIKWKNSAEFESKLEQIITQKWIATFPLGIEAWTEYRRTGYPKLMEAVNNMSAGTVESSKMARRLMYPQSEYTENRENVNEAVAKLLYGPDNLGTNLWWAKKN